MSAATTGHAHATPERAWLVSTDALAIRMKSAGARSSPATALSADIGAGVARMLVMRPAMYRFHPSTTTHSTRCTTASIGGPASRLILDRATRCGGGAARGGA